MLWHGKNFRGFLNKASQVLFNNTGTDLISTNAEDAIKEVNSNLSAHTFGSVVNISNYTDSSNPYVFPNDGYINLSAQGDTSICAFILTGGSGNVTQTVFGRTVSGTAKWDNKLVYVKKGMSCYHKTDISSGTQGATFIPLV